MYVYVKYLLGEPIQREISSESGIELVLDSVSDITNDSNDLSAKIIALRDLCSRASQMSVAISDRLQDLSRQLASVKKQCSGRDGPLCDTINAKALEINVKFDKILKEHQLLELQELGSEKLTQAADSARRHLRLIPDAVVNQTADIRERIKNNMESRFASIQRSARILNDMVRYLSATLRTNSREVEHTLSTIRSYDSWREIAMLGCAVSIVFTIFLTTCGLLCGCGKTTSHARRTLIVSVFFMTIVSLFVWFVAIATFVIAGHAEVYVCKALWDRPKYQLLSSMLDSGSTGARPESRGFLNLLFSELDNVTIDVPIRDVIRHCGEDKPAYKVFRLERVFDISKQTDYLEWSDLKDSLHDLSDAVDVGDLKNISAELSHTLQDMLRVSKVDMASYRKQYNGPLVGKDLASLAEQLENVASQLSDLGVSARVETLVSRTRRLLASNIAPLEHLRSELVYRMTELELQLVPFHKQLNTSLSHIRTMQYYVDNQGAIIAEKKILGYVARILSHSEDWRQYSLRTVETRAGRCKPLFNIFTALRSLTCSHYISSLHGFWLCSICCLLLWCYAVPFSLHLSRHLNIKESASEPRLLERSESCQQELTSIDSSWNIPAPPPPQNEGW